MGLMDSLLDSSLDDVETAPEFVDLPNGEYVLHIKKSEAKEMPAKEDKPAAVAVTVTYEVRQTVALADTSKEPVDEGSMSSERFNLTETGKPYFKRYLQNIFGDTTGVSLGESIQALNGLDITCVVRNNEYKGKSYLATTRQASA